MKILLVNPPIYDFSAFDFWLKPYGLLRVGGALRDQADLRLFDFLDRRHPDARRKRCDDWGRGKFMSEVVAKPAALCDIPRHYRRYGLPRESFRRFLDEQGPFDYALIQTSMTYWYPGVAEVLETLTREAPATRTVLGGVYASICPEHARSLGPDLVIEGDRLDPLWEFLECRGDLDQPPYWEGYERLDTGVLKLAEGCPFRCTYCSVPRFQPEYRPGSLGAALDSLDLLVRLGSRQIVFYDDALLFRPDSLFLPFLEALPHDPMDRVFHTPNALNARFLNDRVAERMAAARFRFLYLGFESDSMVWQRRTGGKVYPEELERAVQSLARAGIGPEWVTCYLIVGHPRSDGQAVEHSMQYAHSLGLRVMLSEYSPIPGTPDGELCRSRVDLDEPLNHNKTASAHRHLGRARLQELKDLANDLNREIETRGGLGGPGSWKLGAG
ncbi:MAG: radical SAM protein [Acidobacteriota bacterium]